MRAGREEGSGQVYDQQANLVLFKDEYVVSKDKGFVGSNCPEAPYPVTEASIYLTNWRIVALGPIGTQVEVDRVQTGTHAHLTVGQSRMACDFLEVYLDEVKEFKKSLMGELKLRMKVGTVEISGVSKPFKTELSKALDWYLKSHR